MSSDDVAKHNDNAFILRLREVAGVEWGSKKRMANMLSLPQSTFASYLNARAVPPVEVLWAIAELTGVSLDWLIAGEGPKWRAAEPGGLERIPIVGRVPAGPPGGEAWAAEGAQDVLSGFTAGESGHTIALRVVGDSMFPTLLEDDLVVVVANGEQAHRGDLVVAEVAGHYEDYVVKRLGQATETEVMLVSDNYLQHPPLTLTPDQVQIRGLVTKVIRTPRRRSPPVDPALLEVYQNPRLQEALAEAVRSPRLQEALMEVVDNPRLEKALEQMVKLTPAAHELLVDILKALGKWVSSGSTPSTDLPCAHDRGVER